MRRASQSRRGKTLIIMSAFNSRSSCTSSASLGCSGYDLGELLQALTAHVKKLSVRTFMIEFCFSKLQCRAQKEDSRMVSVALLAMVGYSDPRLVQFRTLTTFSSSLKRDPRDNWYVILNHDKNPIGYFSRRLFHYVIPSLGTGEYYLVQSKYEEGGREPSVISMRKRLNATSQGG